MRLTIKKQIGKQVYPFTFEGDNLHDVVMQSQKLSFGNVYKCGICGSEHLALSAHVAQGYKYTEVRCLDPKCRASLTFGQRREDSDTFFYRRKEDKSLDWQPFKRDNNDEEKIDSTNDDLPF